ncbi:hypothetical protein AAG906_003887 [Vitis piasezkii]
MALELVGGAFLRFSQVLFDRLASSDSLDFIRGQKLSDSLLSKLKIKLLIVDAVLNHAEMKQFTDPAVKEWLLHVKGALYDAEDLLDEIATEALRCKMEADDHSQTGSAQVWNSISTWVKAPFANYQSSIESRVKEMIGQLEDLAQAIDKLGLKPGDDQKLPPRSPSTSLVDESCVFGRNEIKEEIMTRLLSDNVSTNKIDVISIVGMGGAGKTTLAQLLYNDARVEERFDLKAWVCVSEEFLLVRVTKLILEGIGCATPSDMQSDNLDLLQLKLKGSLGDKKFLLVLDNVWEKGCSEWDRLRIPLLGAGKGSKVVVTTRNRKVAAVMRANHPHYLLGELSAEDCWSLFKKLAFENGDSTAFPQLESIGRKIVAKCQGLPLAEWEEILESEIWGWKNLEILPSLILSYHDLPLHLKRCFTYCSIFPKDHEFDKKKLILLWMAEGFLRLSWSNRRMEEVGDSYFHELLCKSFFQKSVSKESCFVMHDLIHDLAQYMSGEFCVRLEDVKVQKLLRRLIICVTSKVINGLYLRVLHDILLKMRYLRVLSLHDHKITNLPDSIGKLIYLRYLDLSYTGIKKLPDSVCYLYNLQTMILLGCSDLNELPSRIEKLINLRYLNFSGLQLREMPSHIGQLKSLQQLTNFIVGQKSGLRIGELGELSDIGGTLDIYDMENVACAKDALQANMRDKKRLDELALNWSYKIANGVVIQSGISDHILNNLQPHPNLKQFKITNYPGGIFPHWLGDRSFSNLLYLELWDCENCSSLPPLGMTGIERVGSEFYGDASSSITIKPSFPSLQTLRFEYMGQWQRWLCCGCRRGEFPCLQELYIKKCPKLTGKLPKQLRCLKKLEIDGCPQLLVASLKVPAISELRMWKFGKLRLKRPASGFTALRASNIEISDVSQSLEKGGLFVTLKSLNISGCNKVEFLLPELGNRAPLNHLVIERCPNLVYIELPALDSAYYTISKCLKLKLLAHTLSSLGILLLEDCPELLNLLDWGLQRMAYTSHNLSWMRRPWTAYCPLAQLFSILPLFKNYSSTSALGLQSLTELGLQHLTSLETLAIWDFPKLQYLTKERLPDSLCCLSVNNCPLLGKRCQFEKGQEWCYIAHIPKVLIDQVLQWAFLIFFTYFSYAGMGKPGRYSRLAFLEKFGCREPALSSLEELRISNFPKLQLHDKSALFWNISDSLQRGKIGVLF